MSDRDSVKSSDSMEDMPMKSSLNRWQSVMELHGDLTSDGSSEFKRASFNDEIQQDTSAMSSDMSPLTLVKPAAKRTELVTNAVIMAIVDSMKDCLHVTDDSHILQLFTSVAQKLEFLASTSGSQKPYESEGERSSLDLHCMASADNCKVASDFMALDDDSDVDNASFSQVSFGSDTDVNNDFFSCCEDFPLPNVEGNLLDEFRTTALHAVTAVLSHFDSDTNMPETLKNDFIKWDDSYFTTPDLDIVASEIVKKFAADLSVLLHIAHVKHLAGDNITDLELWRLAHDAYTSVSDEFIVDDEELSSVGDHEGEQTDTAGSETQSWRQLQTPRPVMILETIPEVDEPSDDSSYSSENTEYMSPLSELSESQSLETSNTTKKRFHFKKPKMKNPFKKVKKGQKGTCDSVDQTHHCLTHTDTNSFCVDSKTGKKKKKKRSIFSRIFSFFSCIN